MFRYCSCATVSILTGRQRERQCQHPQGSGGHLHWTQPLASPSVFLNLLLVGCKSGFLLFYPQVSVWIIRNDFGYNTEPFDSEIPTWESS